MAVKGFHIGTSGWSYKGWIGDFYPENLSTTKMLSQYAKCFGSVEVNTSFYGTPKKKTITTWCADTPQEFIFSCKASRYITHLKRLHDAKDALAYLYNAFEPFAEKLGPILFQLPPRFHVDVKRLLEFLNLLSKDYDYTFEFRDRSWLCDEIYDILQTHEISLCFYDFRGYRSPEIVTGNFIYLRLHGPEPQPYQGHYSQQVLAEYADKFIHWQEEGKPVYCYFDNDQKVCAPHDAMQLIQELSTRL
ncbi:DUF72 domain-containing protein [Legionella jordanis]|uniref:DUF72 domain-containing protein n=1 Tax=Legionella jordanis TaxID=456 RepID=A0A0W0V9P2_9GAMM|nr:DUF72 domain-containing protein [Legionella jordanis]KTD16799.1 hypothetical protein Ljor_1105 [Legionella jordanis]RMX03676.1 DUF72 domain-containing protein [Legionella jordanis]RMX22263.1 DUF72 domain-containing protein [Legionella jordanis]VEH11734.1 Protein of uncharacterised function DUF72 [Legionella jordanis]HAT8712954.1 DUF72 domain-containing protein [Legionella jordanis]